MVALQAHADGPAAEPRREAERCLGKWRGSAVARYLSTGDAKTFKDSFRCSRETFGLLQGLLTGSGFATAADTCTVWRTAQLVSGNKRQIAPCHSVQDDSQHRSTQPALQDRSVHVRVWSWRSSPDSCGYVLCGQEYAARMARAVLLGCVRSDEYLNVIKYQDVIKFYIVS